MSAHAALDAALPGAEAPRRRRVLVLAEHPVVSALIEAMLGDSGPFEFAGAVATVDEVVQRIGGPPGAGPDAVLAEWQLSDGPATALPRLLGPSGPAVVFMVGPGVAGAALDRICTSGAVGVVEGPLARERVLLALSMALHEPGNPKAAAAHGPRSISHYEGPGLESGVAGALVQALRLADELGEALTAAVGQVAHDLPTDSPGYLRLRVIGGLPVRLGRCQLGEVVGAAIGEGDWPAARLGLVQVGPGLAVGGDPDEVRRMVRDAAAMLLDRLEAPELSIRSEVWRGVDDWGPGFARLRLRGRPAFPERVHGFPFPRCIDEMLPPVRTASVAVQGGFEVDDFLVDLWFRCA